MIRATIDDPDTWDDADLFLSVFAEAIKSLRLADGNLPTSAEMYLRMATLKGCVEANKYEVAGEEVGLDEDEVQCMLKSVDKRWDMLHNEIHGAGFLLNPRYRDEHNFDGSCYDDLLKFAEWHLSNEEYDKFLDQLDKYKEKDGEFGPTKKMWDPMQLKLSADAWWRRWGNNAPEL